MNAGGNTHRVVLVTAAFGLALAATFPAAAAASPAPPKKDPFYSYSGSLKKIAPGTVLRTREITTGVSGAPTAYPATQVLYRTTSQLGRPSATVATIIRPQGAGVGPVKLMSYQTAYDGVSDTCRPSYQLDGGQPDNSIVTAETPIIFGYVKQGFTVVTSDYEGPTDDYGAGREEGRGTLDAIRAAEHVLHLKPTAGVGLLGYSGGSIASEWASQEQPSYAPELHIIGVAEGGIPADFTHNLAYISGSSNWAGAIPAVGIGLARAYRLHFRTYLSARGLKIVKQVAKGCLNASAYPGLRFQDLFKSRYKDWKKVPIFGRIFNDSIMGRGSTPKEPLLMGVGDADGTGDGVMVVKDVQELAHTYCARKVNVQFHIYNHDNHVEAVPQFEAQALQFLQERYAGVTPTSGCGSIAAGNLLTPLPVPVLKLIASPRRVVVGRRVRVAVRLVIQLAGREYPLPGALVAVDRRHVRTNARGRATIRLRFERFGPVWARANVPGWNQASAEIVVARR